MKTKALPFAIVCLFSVFFAVSAIGDEKEKVAATPDKTGMVGGMSMMEMTGKSRGECVATSDTLNGLLKTVQEGKRSNDKAKMQAALQRVEDHITAMKSHMGQCMDMMGMMGKMMGDGMMGQRMMGGKMAGSDSAAPKAGAKPGPKAKSEMPDPSEHEKHHPK